MKCLQKIKLSSIALLFSFSVIASIDVQQSVLNMKVTTDGIYRVSYEDILNLSIDLSGIPIGKIAIYNNGQAIATKIATTNQQETFGAGSYIEFIGFTDENIYQNGSVYSLVLANGVKIKDQVVSYDDSQQVESFYFQTDIYNDNNEYSFGSPIDDPWYAKRIVAIGSSVSEGINFSLDNLINQGDVQLEMKIWGGTDYLQSPDHHVIYNLNGNEIDDFWFDGIIADSRNYQLSTNGLSAGIQQLTITVPNDTETLADVIHIESWKVTFPRAYVMNNQQIDFSIQNNQITQTPNEDMVFSNGFEASLNNYLVQNASDENYSVYKILNNGITQGYQSESQGSCSNVENQGCSLKFAIENSPGHVFIAAQSQIKKPVLSVPVMLTEIKQLGATDYLIIAHPDFIGNELDQFIQLKALDYDVELVDVEQIYAQFGFNNVSADSISSYIKYAHNNLGISDVLLIGGDTYDYKNYLGLNSISYIPTLYVQTDSLIRFAPADAKFTDIDNDDIPDINIGRFPVRTVVELANLIQKISAYTNKSYGLTSVFAADKLDISAGYSFKNDAEFLIDVLPPEWKDNINLNSKAYIDDDGVDVAKAKISNNINQGVALTSFIGHSGPRDWSSSRMFSASDAQILTNTSTPTLVTQWGCWNTYFVSPQEDTLAHAFMLNQNGGAASVLGASTLTKAAHEKGLAALVLTYLTRDQMTLGDAVTQAKRTYAQTNPDALDVILGWNILGDPALKL